MSAARSNPLGVEEGEEAIRIEREVHHPAPRVARTALELLAESGRELLHGAYVEVAVPRSRSPPDCGPERLALLVPA